MEAIARRYAKFGWPVVPVHTPTGDPARPCSCRRVNCPGIGKHPCHKNTCKNQGKHPCHQSVCNRVGKHPRTKKGVHDASTDETKIHQWWEMWESANIAIALGKVAGIFVLDVDPRNGGDETMSSLERKYGRLPKTRTAGTGGGGAHHLFRYPGFPVKNSAGELGPGMDIKSDGGSIVVPPSLHVNGKRYRWRNCSPIADAPDWFLQLLRDAARKSYAIGQVQIGGTILEGRRNTTLTSLAGSMRRRGLDAVEIEPSLLVVNERRCDPPLPEDEVREIAAGVCRYEPADKLNHR
jgi:bifunctional DNA primase/polymerase-like protein/primase-like protein